MGSMLIYRNFISSRTGRNPPFNLIGYPHAIPSGILLAIIIVLEALHWWKERKTRILY